MGLLEDAIASGDEQLQAELSSFIRDAQETHRAVTGNLPGLVTSRDAPYGMVAPRGVAALPAPTRAALDEMTKIEARALVDKRMQDEEFDRHLRTANVVKQLGGLDPQLQGHILRKLGMAGISTNVPVIEDKATVQARANMGLEAFKHNLGAEEREQKRRDDINYKNAQLLERHSQNEALNLYRAELAGLRADTEANKKIDRLAKIAGILESGEFLSGIPQEERDAAKKSLYREAVAALNEKHEATGGSPRPSFMPPPAHPLAAQGYNPALVSPGSTHGGESMRPSAPDLTTGIQVAPGVVIKDVTPNRAGPTSVVPQKEGTSIVPGVVPGDVSGWNYRSDPSFRDPRSTQLYKNEFGEWIQPGFENAPTRTKVPTRNNPTTRSYLRDQDKRYR